MGSQREFSQERDSARAYRNGAVGGLLSGIVVILFFLAADILIFEPFATPRFLVGTLFQREVGAEVAEFLSFLPVWLFTFVHLLAFIGIGVSAAALNRASGLTGNILAGGIYCVLAGTILLRATLFLTETRMAQAPGWLLVIVANFIAGMAIALYVKEDNGS